MESHSSNSHRDMTVDQIHAAMPAGGLFEGKDWLLSPRPLALEPREAKALENLGHTLAQFQKACDRIYRSSRAGKSPSWLANMLDAGKPSWMTEAANVGRLAEDIPRVLRPDLLLTDEGWSITELDSLPGGIGLTAWLAQTYSSAGWDVIGGEKGMLDGFGQVVPKGGHIIVSDESGDYRPEMEWLVEQLGENRSVGRAEEFSVGDAESVYRFFEAFDWENIPAARELAESHAAGAMELTPPLRPHLEEKIWLALLWAPALAKTWAQEMRGAHLRKLKEFVPFGWAVDNAELPPIATLPRLDARSWSDVAAMSQKERELVLKISGFSEEAWGSRGVYIGHDMPSEDWSAVIDRAVSDVGSQGWMMQEFKSGRIIEHPYFDAETGVVRIMEGRVRVCPYYFHNENGRTTLGGCLATIVPKDKKKIHGMKDGILVPCVVAAKK